MQDHPSFSNNKGEKNNRKTDKKKHKSNNKIRIFYASLSWAYEGHKKLNSYALLSYFSLYQFLIYSLILNSVVSTYLNSLQ